jgi:hypothetical protein
MLTVWFKSLAAWQKRSILGVSLFICGILYLKVISPVFHIHIQCLFHGVTGLYCPGCGLTRACLALLHLDIYQAFRYNMILFILPPIYLLYFMLELAELKKQSKLVMAFMLVIAILFGILRNIPMFEWLEPTIILD